MADVTPDERLTEVAQLARQIAADVIQEVADLVGQAPHWASAITVDSDPYEPVGQIMVHGPWPSKMLYELWPDEPNPATAATVDRAAHLYSVAGWTANPDTVNPDLPRTFKARR